MLIKKNYSSQPQYENCTRIIHVPLIEYQTLAVDTKNLRLISRLQATLVSFKTKHKKQQKTNACFCHIHSDSAPQIWRDPELKWNTILTNMQHSSQDLLAYSNGTVRHSVIINAEVNCEVNLFNYPFAADACPVAIQSWSIDGCGSELALGDLKMVDSTHGDWKTDSVYLQKKRDDRNYILVALSIKYTNPFITLLLPTILIVLADVVSFSLPLGGGERNSFKVTLVLSFTLFLGILNDKLPGDSQCSPIIRTHFCVCLVLLVLSMLVSLVLTRVAKDGGIILCCCSKLAGPKKTGDGEDKEDEGEEDLIMNVYMLCLHYSTIGLELSVFTQCNTFSLLRYCAFLTEATADISVVQLNGPDDTNKMLRKVVNFLQACEDKDAESERRQIIANALDRTFFWFYLIFGSVYFCSMTYVMVNYTCTVNHFDFWY
ncbi:hypothetical protein F2P81_015047 [Scophthalmus maximus]|uniref:Uncharacterized protein n=1 Tax=Scophthalmus maximus TaxID=52904 RepID=A0A6A4SHQ2_SCOMX|nr:hypothetical protein F2P81_015047 [Scophthalmus maximus]